MFEEARQLLEFNIPPGLLARAAKNDNGNTRSERRELEALARRFHRLLNTRRDGLVEIERNTVSGSIRDLQAEVYIRMSTARLGPGLFFTLRSISQGEVSNENIHRV